MTYLWTGPNTSATTPTITVSEPGLYTCVATSTNGCTISKTSNVTLNAVLPIALAIANGEINCTNKSVDISTTGSSTGPNYVYSWTGPSGYTNSANNISVVESGLYTLVILNTDNGCEKSVTVNVPLNKDVPTGLISLQKNPNCFGNTDGNIQILNVQGGTQPFLYSINNKAFTTSNQFGFLGEGTYKISVQDAVGCE